MWAVTVRTTAASRWRPLAELVLIRILSEINLSIVILIDPKKYILWGYWVTVSDLHLCFFQELSQFTIQEPSGKIELWVLFL